MWQRLDIYCSCREVVPFKGRPVFSCTFLLYSVYSILHCKHKLIWSTSNLSICSCIQDGLWGSDLPSAPEGNSKFYLHSAWHDPVILIVVWAFYFCWNPNWQFLTHSLKVYGLDINPRAVKIAWINLYLNALDDNGLPIYDREGKTLLDRVEFYESDLLSYCRDNKIELDRIVGCIPQVLSRVNCSHVWWDETKEGKYLLTLYPYFRFSTQIQRRCQRL